MNLTKEDLIKLWNLSIDSMNRETKNEVSQNPLIVSYSVQLPSFLEEPIVNNIQIVKLQGEKPRISILLANYIEFAYAEITEPEFSDMSQKFIEKNDVIELELRNSLIKKAEKNLEFLLKSI